MPYLAMSLGFRFCMSRRGGGWVHPNSADSMHGRVWTWPWMALSWSQLWTIEDGSSLVLIHICAHYYILMIFLLTCRSKEYHEWSVNSLNLTFSCLTILHILMSTCCTCTDKYVLTKSAWWQHHHCSTPQWWCHHALLYLPMCKIVFVFFP